MLRRVAGSDVDFESLEERFAEILFEPMLSSGGGTLPLSCLFVSLASPSASDEAPTEKVKVKNPGLTRSSPLQVC
jgi:hypothetical protein